MPEEIAEFKPQGERVLLDVLVESGLAPSKSEARRLIQQNGVKIDGVTVDDPFLMVQTQTIVQVGKRHFIRIVD